MAGKKWIWKTSTNLRELVGLPPETETKLDVTKPRRRPKSGQIRKAVKRYTELSKRYKK